MVLLQENIAPPQILYNGSHHNKPKQEGERSIPIIRQDNLFDMQKLFETEPSYRSNAISSPLELDPLLRIYDKKTHRGAPRELNYGVMIY